MPIHISRGDESSGPYSLEEVQAYLDQGLLLPTDLAWQEGMEDWVALPELLKHSATPEPASPPPVAIVAEPTPVEQVPVESVAKPRLRKGLLIGVGAGVAVLVIAAVAWFGFLRPDGSKQEELKVAGDGPKNNEASGGADDSGNDANLDSAVEGLFAFVNPFDPQPVENNATVPPDNLGGNDKFKALPKDIPALKALAEKGDAAAQLRLGVMLALGEGIKKNKREAVLWLSKSAKQGNAEGQYWVGAAYHFGEVVGENYSTAYQWYGKSAIQGFAPANYGMASLLISEKATDGKGRDTDLELGYRMLWIAAGSGDRNAIDSKAKIAADMTQAQVKELEIFAMNFLQGIAFKHHKNGEWRKAKPLYDKALSIGLKALGEGSSELRNTYSNMGIVYEYNAEYDQALEYYQKALTIVLSQPAINSEHAAAAYNNIGSVIDSKGEIDKALKHYQESLEISLKKLNKNHPEISRSYNNIGLVYDSKGEYDKALEYHQKALAIRLEVPGENHPSVATSYNNIGTAYHQMGDYQKALEFHNKALTIRLNKLPEDHPSAAMSYNNIGAVHNDMGDYGKGLVFQKKSLAIKGKKLGWDHPDVAVSYNNIGMAHSRNGEYDKALEYLRKALVIWLEKVGPDYPRVALSHHNMGTFFFETKDYDKAFESFERALVVYKNSSSENGLGAADTYGNISVLLLHRGEYDKALEYSRKSLAIWISQLGEDHPKVAMGYQNLGLMHLDSKNSGEALTAARKDKAIRAKRLAYILSFTSERERLAYQQIKYPYNLLGTLGSAPDLAETVLRNKGIVLASLMEDQRIAKASKDPAIKTLAVQLKSAQYFLNKLQLEIPEPKAKVAHEARRKATMAKVEELQQEMARNVKGLGKARRALAIKPADVQKNLAKDEILLEFIRYFHYSGRDQFQERYGVVLLAKEEQAKWVPLGSAEEIDKLCLNYGSYLKDDRITDEQYVPLLRSLYDRLMAPIAKVAPKDAKTWIISPASQINFVNFATFLTPKERFVCEDYTIKYVASGRDLVPPKGKKPKTNPQLVVFANPKYENKPPTLAVVTRDVGETTLRGAERNDLRASILGLSPLPGTQKEADYLEDKASDWKLEPRIFVDDEAVERQLYQVDSPKVLHLATHGMFLEKPPEKKKSRPGLMAMLLGKSSTQRKDFIGRLQNPMQRSALMFTGATWTSKEWAKGATPDTANDGILTAAEVGTLDLKGTKLVVMSACETGLGDLRSGEGVMGLRRGFIQAGTQNLLMTLWPVSDSLTVAVMKKFYEKAMVEDGDAPVALAEVQREELVAIRKLPQFKPKKIGVKMAVNLAGPFILSFQKEATGEEAADSEKSKSD